MSTEEPLARLARYESLFELCSEINAASEIARVGESMARRLKYVADVFSWRYLSIMSERIGSLSNEGNVLIIDGYRGTTTVSNGLLDQLSSLETRMCAKRKTCFVDGEMLAEMKEALPQQFQKNDIVQLFIYPHFETGELQGLSIFSRRRQAFSELDIKFITLAVQFFHEKVYTLWEQRRLREDNMLLLEETKRARAAAEAANQAKSDFLASVSHELRTPLTSVLGFAKISKQSLENKLFPKIRADDRRTQRDIRFVSENMEIIVTEGQRLTTLINNVLDLAKIEAGKVDWNMQPLAIAEVIERATAATAALFKQKGLQLLKDMPPDLPEIVGDQDKLIQVVINLISNAVKFTPVGSVTCRAEVSSSGVGGMPEREIIVSVIDTGTGIAPEDQPKVFEKFKQVGNTLTDKPQGTGLGLPICKEIVEHHGGRIWVESEVDQGSVFSFALPVQWAETELEVTTQPVELTTLVKQLKEHMVTTAPNGTNRPKTILVVDDEEPIRKLLKQELDEAGYQVKEATNGQEALLQIRRDKPDLVILDVMMPVMNGFKVAAILKNDPQTMDLPIIMLTIAEDAERGYRLGVDRYLNKPIDNAVLFADIEDLLTRTTGPRQVLIVEEDAGTVQTLSEVFQEKEYQVSEARTGAEFVEKAVSANPNIILVNAKFSEHGNEARTARFDQGLDNVVMLFYQ